MYEGRNHLYKKKICTYKSCWTVKFGGGGGIKEKENYLALRALAHIEGMHRA